ncbi:hypothetical protein MB901379_01248 [Mycobacterium basiliense]|uniref:Uncharacterized protein n=1 Tax=Mycobacterium basiliense TaxID=2094119 RepID=A0A3S4FPB5_9MYCO|nr:hypothetical protein [Mycobacterium basiliense]VDM87704.1 hypothetical protein MB901379_01248 [Mycobacterium basiliense]
MKNMNAFGVGVADPVLTAGTPPAARTAPSAAAGKHRVAAAAATYASVDRSPT